MKKNNNAAKRNGNIPVLSVFLVLSMLLCVVAITYGSYTNSQRAQRTIAVYDAGGVRFSSNYLNPGNSRDNVRTLLVTDAAIAPATVVTICNYQQGKQTRPNDDDVTYTVTVRLVKYDAEEENKYVPINTAYLTANSLTGYSVQVKKGSGSTVTLGYSTSTVQQVYADCELEGNSSVSDTFSLTFSTNFAENQPNLYVEMIAVPTDGSLPTLQGIFKTGIRVEGASNAWTGAFAEDQAVSPAGYDGFNYTITGTGSGTFTLKWDGTLLEINPAFLIENGLTKDGNSVTIPVDSDDVARYDVQFYIVGDVSGKSWTDMNSVLGSASAALGSGKAVGYYFATGE